MKLLAIGILFLSLMHMQSCNYHKKLKYGKECSPEPDARVLASLWGYKDSMNIWKIKSNGLQKQMCLAHFQKEFYQSDYIQRFNPSKREIYGVTIYLASPLSLTPVITIEENNIIGYGIYSLDEANNLIHMLFRKEQQTFVNMPKATNKVPGLSSNQAMFIADSILMSNAIIQTINTQLAIQKQPNKVPYYQQRVSEIIDP